MQANQLSVHTEENLVKLYNLPDPDFKLDRCILDLSICAVPAMNYPTASMNYHQFIGSIQDNVRGMIPTTYK